MPDILDNLTDAQREAVTHMEGPMLVVAGAGSGKTRVVTRRIAYLISRGVWPNQILAMTFTNKAAKEMMRRVADLLGQELSTLWGGTFHSIGNRILRQHAPLLGFGRDFTILDREDAVEEPVGNELDMQWLFTNLEDAGCSPAGVTLHFAHGKVAARPPLQGGFQRADDGMADRFGRMQARAIQAILKRQGVVIEFIGKRVQRQAARLIGLIGDRAQNGQEPGLENN